MCSPHLLRVASAPNKAGLASKLFATGMLIGKANTYCCAVGGDTADVYSFNRTGAASLTPLAPEFNIYIELSLQKTYRVPKGIYDRVQFKAFDESKQTPLYSELRSLYISTILANHIHKVDGQGVFPRVLLGRSTDQRLTVRERGSPHVGRGQRSLIDEVYLWVSCALRNAVPSHYRRL